jgi:hypothetical protein
MFSYSRAYNAISICLCKKEGEGPLIGEGKQVARSWVQAGGLISPGLGSDQTPGLCSRARAQPSGSGVHSSQTFTALILSLGGMGVGEEH